MLSKDGNFPNRPAIIYPLKPKFKSQHTLICSKVKLIRWASWTTFVLGAMVKVLIKKTYRLKSPFNQAQIMCSGPLIHRRHPVSTHEAAKLILLLEISVLGDTPGRTQLSQQP